MCDFYLKVHWKLITFRQFLSSPWAEESCQVLHFHRVVGKSPQSQHEPQWGCRCPFHITPTRKPERTIFPVACPIVCWCSALRRRRKRHDGLEKNRITEGLVKKSKRRWSKGWEKGENRLDVCKGDRNNLGTEAGESLFIWEGFGTAPTQHWMQVPTVCIPLPSAGMGVSSKPWTCRCRSPPVLRSWLCFLILPVIRWLHNFFHKIPALFKGE